MIAYLHILSDKRQGDYWSNKIKNSILTRFQEISILENKTEDYWKDERILDTNMSFSLELSINLERWKAFFEQITSISEINEQWDGIEINHYDYGMLPDKDVFVILFIPNELIKNDN